MYQGNQNQKSKKQKIIQKKNVLEQLGEIGTQATNTIASEAKKTGEEILRQLLNQKRQEKTSGTLQPGQSLEFKSREEIQSQAQAEANHKLQDQLVFEKRLFNELHQESERKLGELRFKLKVLSQEALNIAKSAGSLGEQSKMALMQDIVVPSEYQINFLQSVIENLIKFRKTIDSTVNWIAEANKRRQKKNYWSQYKKKGASFLLSGESYSQRSAG